MGQHAREIFLSTLPLFKMPNNTLGIPESIKFTSHAWKKLSYLCAKGDTEIGGFGISSQTNPLLIEDFLMLKQKCTSTFVEFDPDDLNAHMIRCLERGIEPNRCMRVWIHTHPGNSAGPSGVDEKCFKEEFANPDWAIMFILARGGNCTCRLKVNNGAFTMTKELKVEVEAAPPPVYPEWDAEYTENWSEMRYQNTLNMSFPQGQAGLGEWRRDYTTGEWGYSNKAELEAQDKAYAQAFEEKEKVKAKRRVHPPLVVLNDADQEELDKCLAQMELEEAARDPKQQDLFSNGPEHYGTDSPDGHLDALGFG